MRLTVGPLPSAVYWRRRAVVLGALLLVVMVFYASCSGSGSPGADRREAGGGSPSPTPAVTSQPVPTGSVLTPETADPADTATPPQPGGPAQSGPPVAPPPATGGAEAPAATEPCSDSEMAVAPVPATVVISRNARVNIRLMIRNDADRACSRDVGADVQELRIVRGAETIWSSDHCGPARGSDVRDFAPGADREYMVTWNGRSSTKCAGGVPTGPVPPAGSYQLLGRLGTKLSAPVGLSLR
ncbi:MAG TPA: hypothetical protein VES42_25160 [Pilimelia sp.]|nr:hypothetical protein [Pilimelia sp.]